MVLGQTGSYAVKLIDSAGAGHCQQGGYDRFREEQHPQCDIGDDRHAG
jgi:hypothetical protein